MKLIKQNDSAGGLIFKQNQNGKAMKQNYNKSRCLFGAGNSVYSVIPGSIVDSLQDWSIQISYIGQRPTTNGRSVILSIKGINNEQILNIEQYSTSSNVIYVTSRPIYQTAGNTWTYATGSVGIERLLFISVVKTNDKITTYIENSSIQADISAYTNVQFSEILINYGYSTGVNISTGITKISEVRVFNRAIGQVEHSYFKNNGLSNDPLSVLSLTGLFRLENVISQGTGVYIKNNEQDANHAELLGIPSGTVEEQMEYYKNNILSDYNLY